MSLSGSMTSTISLVKTEETLIPVQNEVQAEIIDVDLLELANENAELDNQCSICLQQLVDKTVLHCTHTFCFECILVWSEQSRRCPLCSQPFGTSEQNYLIHHIRSRYDYQKHYLPPLPSSPPSASSSSTTTLPSTIAALIPHRRRAQAEREWGRQRDRRRRERDEEDELERAIARRRWVYRNETYAKHVASNVHTRYSNLTPSVFAASAELQSRAAAFVRRELAVWVCADVEFLTTFTISLLKAIDIRSEAAVKLLAEFLDMEEVDAAGPSNEPGHVYRNAEHFAHEVYCYLRSPFRDIKVYDSVVQYDNPDVPPPTRLERSDRWRPREPSDSPERSRTRTRTQQRGGDVGGGSRERRRAEHEREEGRWGSSSSGKRRRREETPSQSRPREAPTPPRGQRRADPIVVDEEEERVPSTRPATPPFRSADTGKGNEKERARPLVLDEENPRLSERTPSKCSATPPSESRINEKRREHAMPIVMDDEDGLEEDSRAQSVASTSPADLLARLDFEGKGKQRAQEDIVVEEDEPPPRPVELKIKGKGREKVTVHDADEKHLSRHGSQSRLPAVMSNGQSVPFEFKIKGMGRVGSDG